jgi:leukotriene-A4 hydrolase
MEYDDSLARQAYELADRWDAARDTSAEKLPFKESDVADLNSNQKSQSRTTCRFRSPTEDV